VFRLSELHQVLQAFVRLHTLALRYELLALCFVLLHEWRIGERRVFLLLGPFRCTRRIDRAGRGERRKECHLRSSLLAHLLGLLIELLLRGPERLDIRHELLRVGLQLHGDLLARHGVVTRLGSGRICSRDSRSPK